MSKRTPNMKNSKKRVPKRRSDINQTGGLSPLRAPSPRSFMPDQFRTTLRFTKQVAGNLALPGTGSFYFTPTSAFDVDPAALSPTMAGYDQFAAFYTKYRVLSSKIRVQFNNPSVTSPVTVYICPTATTPSAWGPVEILSMKGNPFCKYKMGGLLGSPPTRISNRMTSERIVGSKAVLFDDSYSALTSASPLDNWFWAIGHENPGGIGTVVIFAVEIDVDLIFFDRRFINRA